MQLHILWLVACECTPGQQVSRPGYKCGDESVKLNVKTVETIKAKKLRLNTKKCNVLHIGNKMKCHDILKVNDTNMKSVKQEKYLGQYISSDGKNDRNIEDRCSRGTGIISQVHVMLTASYKHWYLLLSHWSHHERDQPDKWHFVRG